MRHPVIAAIKGKPLVKRVTALRHVAFEDLGCFEPVLRARGFDIHYVDAVTDDLAALDIEAPEPLFVLGGPIGAYEEATYPFLRQELALIERRLAARLPLAGVCLGAQLIARALGSRVYPARAKEIGWAPVALTGGGRQSALRHIGNGPVLHWHGDTFELPAGAIRLASTEICINQAFSYGAAVLACQFHPEAEAKALERWFVGHTAELGGIGLSVAALRRDTAIFAAPSAARGRACLTEWLDGLICATPEIESQA